MHKSKPRVTDYDYLKAVFEEKIWEEFGPIIKKIKNIYNITEEITAKSCISSTPLHHVEISLAYPSKKNASLFVQYEDTNFSDFLHSSIESEIKENDKIKSSSFDKRTLIVLSSQPKPKNFSELEGLLKNYESEKRIKVGLLFHQHTEEDMIDYAKSVPD